ncbi:hypothetical protein TNIN_275731 [Trichonephila inaurata madagascariensis]|uniref:Uncharacterized protein n=1 Tax=Trichonephila inaurata madagascariensis TaxID=2747483 RepID=A0A8X6WWQ1_9ARAC|nr:hypothetical protein TNIN_275731 [Trichonephila inaurata madagascariensis]
MRERSTFRNSQKHFIPKRKHFLSPTITTHQGLSDDTVATYFESKPGIFSDKVFESGVSPTLVNSEISRRGGGREITSDFSLFRERIVPRGLAPLVPGAAFYLYSLRIIIS